MIDEDVRFAQGFVEDTTEVEGLARRVRGTDVVAEGLRSATLAMFLPLRLPPLHVVRHSYRP